ncbi:MAG: glycosyltransferase, partial [Solirubrobacteraceae bacterium]
MRALVVSNMLPDPAHPERGSFVRDQVEALQRLDGLDVELYEFAPGAASLARAARHLRRRGDERLDVVHAHYGLTAWPALAVPADVHALTLHGTDLRHPRTRLITRAALGRIDLLATVSDALAQELPSALSKRAQALPCGVQVDRFRPMPREQARQALGLDPAAPFLLFAADPTRQEKRHDRAAALAARAGVALLTLGGVKPADVALSINAANAVLVPSDREGFGLAVLEALACDVPVLATPVGIHAEALADLPSTLCAPFDLDRWSQSLAPLLAEPDPRVAGRTRAERWS